MRLLSLFIFVFAYTNLFAQGSTILFKEGTYSYDNQSSVGSIRIYRSSPKSFYFILQTVTERGCFGEAEGSATVQGRKATFYGAEGCVLEFEIQKNTIEVSEKKYCSLYHGISCAIGGKFVLQELPSLFKKEDILMAKEKYEQLSASSQKILSQSVSTQCSCLKQNEKVLNLVVDNAIITLDGNNYSEDKQKIIEVLAEFKNATHAYKSCNKAYNPSQEESVTLHKDLQRLFPREESPLKKIQLFQYILIIRNCPEMSYLHKKMLDLASILNKKHY